jgi:hypothetical protein
MKKAINTDFFIFIFFPLHQRFICVFSRSVLRNEVSSGFQRSLVKISWLICGKHGVAEAL